MTRRSDDSGNDDAEVISFPASEEDDEEEVLSGWSTPVNLADALKGKPPPGPAICSWEDGALFYPNEVHSVFGEPEAMKSWLLLHAACQGIDAGHHVFFIDMEANDRSIVARLLALGLAKKQVKRFFHYFRPDSRITGDDHEGIAALIERYEPSLVVLDGVTEALAMHDLSSNSPEDIAWWFHRVARRYQVKSPTPAYLGPAIVELDHVVKARDGRNGWAIGSGHKKAGIKGAAYQIEASRPFGKGRLGISRVFLEKDSPGGVAWSPYGKDRRRLVVEFHCKSDLESGAIDAYLESPTPDENASSDNMPPTETHEFRALMERVWHFVSENPSCSGRLVREGVTGTSSKVGAAIEVLLRDGCLSNEGTSAHRLKLITAKPYHALRVEPKKDAKSAKTAKTAKKVSAVKRSVRSKRGI